MEAVLLAGLIAVIFMAGFWWGYQLGREEARAECRDRHYRCGP